MVPADAPAPDDPPDREPLELDPTAQRPAYVDHFEDIAHDLRWRVVAANGLTISGGSEGYSHKRHVVRSLQLTLEALLRHPNTTGVLAKYLAELDATGEDAAILRAAINSGA